jgi:hypothetical protein
MMEKVKERSIKLSSDMRLFQTDAYTAHFYTLTWVYSYLQMSDYSMHFVPSHI